MLSLTDANKRMSHVTDLKKQLDQQFNVIEQRRLEPLATRPERTEGHLKANDLFVGNNKDVGNLTSSGNLQHFGLSQAFAWEYLRKKQKIEQSDIAYAKQLQEEIESQLQKEQELLRQEEEQESEKLVQQLQNENKPPPQMLVNNGLTDSQFARLLSEEENPKTVALLDQSDFARKLFNEVLSIDAKEAELRDSVLARILQEEFEGKDQPNAEYEIDDSHHPTAGNSMDDHSPVTLQCVSLVYSNLFDVLENFESRHSVCLPHSLKPKFTKGDTLRIVNVNHASSYCYASIRNFKADAGTCIVSEALFNNLHIQVSENVRLEKTQFQQMNSVEFQPTSWSFFEANLMDKFIAEITNKYCAIYKNQMVDFENNNIHYQVAVKTCLPTVGKITSNTIVDVLPPLDPPVVGMDSVPTLSEKQKVNVLVKAQKYNYFKIELPCGLADLSQDLVISLENEEGFPYLFVDQVLDKPSRTQHTWSSLSTLLFFTFLSLYFYIYLLYCYIESFTIHLCDPKLRDSLANFYLSVRAPGKDATCTLSWYLTRAKTGSLRDAAFLPAQF